jgi:hypothetical protein
MCTGTLVDYEQTVRGQEYVARPRRLRGFLEVAAHGIVGGVKVVVRRGPYAGVDVLLERARECRHALALGGEVSVCLGQLAPVAARCGEVSQSRECCGARERVWEARRGKERVGDELREFKGGVGRELEVS